MKIIRVDFTVTDDVDVQKFSDALTAMYEGSAGDDDISYVLNAIHSTRVEGERR